VPTVKVAVVQLNASVDKEANLARAEGLVRAAAADGAKLVALPEYFSCYGRAVDPESMAELYAANAETVPGPTTERLGRLARELRVSLLGGSIFERSGDRVFNTSTLYDTSGALVAAYRKIHLFEARAPELTYHEGSAVTAGDEVVAADLELGGEQLTVGMSICYDVRFPEHYRSLANRGASLLVVPAAFPTRTGKDHWELLLRARAVENQAYLLAPAQWGPQSDGSTLYGRSLIVDVWGTIIATVPDGEGYAVAPLDLARLAEYREYFPNLANRRPDLYEEALARA
jgi:predicted amidohydrolase